MTKQELAAAMYETMIRMGERNNLGFDRQPASFKLLSEGERGRWIDWADAVMTQILPSNVEPIKR